MNKENGKELQLLSAEEAYSIARAKKEEVDKRGQKDEWEKVIRAINKATDLGETRITIGGRLSPKSEIQLIELGYKIKSSGYKEVLYPCSIISWDKPKLFNGKEKFKWKRELENFIRNLTSC